MFVIGIGVGTLTPTPEKVSGPSWGRFTAVSTRNLPNAVGL